MLTFIEKVGNEKHGAVLARYKCICGNETIARKRDVKRGNTKSCGCLKRSIMNSIGAKSVTHGLSKHPLYRVWATVIQRCEDTKAINYERYGGRGVKMCDEWRSDFKKFYDWSIENGWSKNLVLDKDIKANELGVEALLYSPDMCQYVTAEVNNSCKRNTVYVEWNNEKLTLRQLSEKYNIKLRVLAARFHNGWPIDRLLNQKVRKSRIRKPNFINYAFGHIN